MSAYGEVFIVLIHLLPFFWREKIDIELFVNHCIPTRYSTLVLLVDCYVVCKYNRAHSWEDKHASPLTWMHYYRVHISSTIIETSLIWYFIQVDVCYLSRKGHGNNKIKHYHQEKFFVCFHNIFFCFITYTYLL